MIVKHVAQTPLRLRLRGPDLNKKITPAPSLVQAFFYETTLTIHVLFAVPKQPEDKQEHIDEIKIQRKCPKD